MRTIRTPFSYLQKRPKKRGKNKQHLIQLKSRFYAFQENLKLT